MDPIQLKPWSDKVWFTSRFAIHYFSTLHKYFGQAALSGNRFKKEREAWIMGVALLGINKLTNQTWWLQIPPNDPPDMECMFMEPKGDFNMLNYRHVEIMEVTKYNKGILKEEIKKKLHNKMYGKEFALLVYLRRDEVFPDLKSLSDEVCREKINIADIWCIGNTSPGTANFMLFSLYPSFSRVDFSLTVEADKIPKGDFLTLYKAKGTKMILERTTTPNDFVPSRRY